MNKGKPVRFCKHTRGLKLRIQLIGQPLLPYY